MTTLLDLFDARRRERPEAVAIAFGNGEAGGPPGERREVGRRPGAVGVPLPGVAVRIIGARDRDVPDREYGEVPVAYVVATDGGRTDPQAILAHCRKRLAGFKVPVDVILVPELPRNALGKVQKHRLGTR